MIDFGPILDIRMSPASERKSVPRRWLLISRGVRRTAGSAEKSENARTRRSSASISSTTIFAACVMNCRSDSGCRARISSTVSRIGVREFFSSCAILRASVCQLAICVR